ncbi:cytochrome c oxidase assembly protein [Ventosimonas gracilis]|uniref:Cytochrome c oxidase assembly protein n=1 Tax=Ventosimonas gracilis TaxID=1680762 RepID=A0A139SIW5_9GAMM|nr:SCO family protein [Ventosimonas gracilis]KXU34461.1 cytochrome c oxidase assembly protein [Ventosimonas gracilis]
MRPVQKTLLVLLALVALIFGLTVHRVLNQKGALDSATLADAGIILLPQSRTLPEFNLIDQNGQRVFEKTLTGVWSLLFFGYTYCPDICPATLAELRELRSKLSPELRDKLRVVLVSVDPERDTPAQLAQYVGYFAADFQGWSGELDQIQSLSSRLGIPFIPADTSKPGYTVSHSGNLAIIGPDGNQQGFIRAPLNTAKLAVQLPLLLESGR